MAAPSPSPSGSDRSEGTPASAPRMNEVPVIATRRAVRNWARNEGCVPDGFARPRTVEEVAALVRHAHHRGGRVKVIGGGHSCSPIAMTNGTLLSLDDLRAVTEVDRATGVVTAQAGIRLGDLGRKLADLGLAMSNLGTVDTPSLAGALATGTHGTGPRPSVLAAAVVGLELVTGTGEIRRLSRAQDPELFRAALVHLGALGVVTSVTLQCEPAFALRVRETIDDLDEVLADLDGVYHSADHVVVTWMPGSRTCVVRRGHRTTQRIQPRDRWRRQRDRWFGAHLGRGAAIRFASRFPSLAPRVAQWMAESTRERSYLDRSHDAFVEDHPVRFVQLEYGLAMHDVAGAMDAIREMSRELEFPPLFPVEVRSSAPDDIPLSTAYGRQTGWISVRQYRTAPHEAYLRSVEAIMDSFDGRPHWGMLHAQRASALSRRYPDWEVFADARRRSDPTGVFRNQYLDRVLGPIR